ncbi:MrcB family domain-containing protein [Comamonas sp. B-9]|uniref:MrcB family domain-containing protein n=1 Tax=Comamonas sp. B-9 TaxID=1055192 RepID=UPI0004061868|nr:DUF3578 domain-containing protein [Comamonas sp. B-9]
MNEKYACNKNIEVAIFNDKYLSIYLNSMQALKDVLDNYHESLKGVVAIRTRSVDQQAIFEKLPNFFQKIIDHTKDGGDFIVQPSIGAGNMASIPWVAILKKSVTLTAQDGYYIVLLFAQDMKSCTLSLDQGVTELGKKYSSKLAIVKAREFAERAVLCFKPDPRATIGPINLAAKSGIGKAYEAAAIESFRYEVDNLPSEETLIADFEILLDHYERLIEVAGSSLESLAPITERQYQAAVQGIAELDLSASLRQDVPKKKPQPVSGVARTCYSRDPSVAIAALSAANFQCEVESGHRTFTSKAKRRQYIEAHHLIPISVQDEFEYSLDVSANVVGLCPLCHKLLHLGMPADKKPILNKLFEERRDRLRKSGIPMTEKDLFQHYKTELAEEDA